MDAAQARDCLTGGTVLAMPIPPENYDSTRHPDLLAWLTERQAGFERWAHETGGDTLFGFSNASLDALENLIKAEYSEMEEITAQRGTPFIQGAVWYVGEAARRRNDGWVWKFEPDMNSGELAAFFPPVEHGGLMDHPCLGAPDAGPGEHWFPLNTLRRVIDPEDILGDPVDECLVGMIEGWYDEDDEE
ncbi:hypothetical protein T261_8320 [Streptomyces lydicus]|nr:hypothetical protein T261_8320 [Streptomyces lydicus]